MLVESNAKTTAQAALDRQSFQNALLAMQAQAQVQPAKNTTSTTKTIQRKLVDPGKYCGGPRDLDRFLTQLRRRYETHPQQFENDTDRIDYAISLLGKWSNNDDTSLWSTKMMNPIDWGTSLLSSTNPCLADFKLFEKEITRMYGDRDWRLKASAKASAENIQGQAPADSSETVREYANRIRTNWREAGWDEAKFEPMLYDLAWNGIRYGIQSRIKPLANEESP